MTERKGSRSKGWKLRLRTKAKTDEQSFESAMQALGALDWILVRVVLNVRARTATAFRQDLAEAGIGVPESITESPKWLRAFHDPISIANHKDGFEGLLRDRLLELDFEEDAVGNAIKRLEQDLAELHLDVQAAVVKELLGDLEAIGVHVHPSVLDSAQWRDVFARRQMKLLRAAESIVKNGTDPSVFLAIEESSGCNSTPAQ